MTVASAHFALAEEKSVLRRCHGHETMVKSGNILTYTALCDYSKCVDGLVHYVCTAWCLGKNEKHIVCVYIPFQICLSNLSI